MTSERFLAGLTGHDNDLQLVAQALKAAAVPFCLIGGLAMNHYVEPVVTLDADFAVAGHSRVAQALRDCGFEVEEHPYSLNAQLPGSRLRVQITLDERYQAFPARAVMAEIFGVRLPVAALQDLVQGKLWALADPRRRASKKAKDKADLIRVCESHARIIPLIPPGLLPEVDALR
ncbi:MAG TPA: hypothetical protein PKI20_12005 [Verrucomicrobiota bacterium]|nr:hypothetical protein [Verrucomicrobiota bacterium]HQL78508.1 hypothetical protein [Verrucomicrobiota bacterium]